MEANRISGMPISIFSTMSKLAIENNAVNLGQGFPDFSGPDWLMDEAFKAMQEGKNQYAPSQGILSLRMNISDAYNRYYGIDVSPDDITIAAGATEALFSAIMAFVENGDEVIMFEPYYDAYYADVILAGGVPKYVTLCKPEFGIDEDELKAQITKKTKMIIINNPHNPTGKVWTIEELKLLSSVAIENDLIVISDEVYEFLTFDGIRHIPISSIPGMGNRTITISSTGKTFGMTGWKIGYSYACNKLTEAIRKVHQWTTFAVNTPGQHAMAYGFTQLFYYLPEFINLYQSKRDLLYNGLQNTAFKAYKPDGSYFMMIDNPTKLTDVELAIELVKNYGLATIPPSAFYSKSNEGESMLRLCFAKSDKTLKQGIERLVNFSKTIENDL